MPKTKTIIIFLTVFFGVLFFTKVSLASTQLSKVDCEDSTSDTFGFMYAENPNVVTYVPGYKGKACRSSHNTDDGGEDFGLTTTAGNSYWPLSNEIYISWRVKYEPEYWGLCSNNIWNVKWLWTLGSDAHNEIIFQSYSNGNIGLAWQMNGGGAMWDSDDPGRVTKYASAPYTFGDWMNVEIYMKLSSGDTHMNPDGVFWLKVNGVTRIIGSSVVTGVPGRLSSPAIKASCDCETGKGWWQLDDYEIWDGLPDITPPAAPTGVTVN